MLTSSFSKYVLNFIKPGGTSRGVLHQKETYILRLFDEETGWTAYGECNLFKGLSDDDRPGYAEKLHEVTQAISLKKEEILPDLRDWPSIYFGVETVLKDWKNGCGRVIFDGDFARGEVGIPINGLVWMGSKDEMKKQIKQKLNEGFTCIKMKIGALDFDSELEVLSWIRKEFDASKVELRVDANGAFPVSKALEKLKRLSEFEIHSIEQPIKAGQWQEMAALVENSPIDIALDEELIGITENEKKRELIETVAPPYIILKPALVGGFNGCDEWISLMENAGGGWWITSALESNIGLNAIAQYAASKALEMPQGLGTGALYSNNFGSPLHIHNGELWSNPSIGWHMGNLSFPE